MSFTESVIKEVQNRPCLWNIHCEAYKHKNEKQKAWREICEKVSSEYTQASSLAEKRDIERAVQLRWKTARDAYMKCRGSRTKTKFKPNNMSRYAFYDILTFLEETISEKQVGTVNNNTLPATSSQDNEIQQYDTQQQSDAGVTEFSNKPPRKLWRRKIIKRKQNRRSDFETQFLNIVQAGINSSLNARATVLQDDDQHFFNSLAPIINDFDNYKKLVFRSRILELAMEIGGISGVQTNTNIGNETEYQIFSPPSETYVIKVEDSE